MIEYDQINSLSLFGLTRQEAIIYITLISNSYITGYEISKLTSISKSNTYSALTNLVSKGAAYIATEEATKYTAVSLEEFCQNRIRRMEEAKKELISNVTIIDNGAEGYITISGKQNVYNKIYNMITGAKHRIYLSVSTELLMLYLSELQNLIEKNIKVVIITDKQIAIAGATIYYTEDIDHKIRIIVDSVEVLSGLLEKNCLYSKNENLISIFKDMLTNEIEINKIKENKGL